MNRNDRGVFWTALLAMLAFLWLVWEMVPPLKPAVALLFAFWLLVVAWLSVKGG